MGLTHERLLEVVSYTPETGVFTWNKKTNKHSYRCKIGAQAGSLSPSEGYRAIWIDGVNYLEHVLAVYYMTAVYPIYPEEEVDHINGVKDDNRIANLRVVSKRGNQQNRKEHREGGTLGCTRTMKKTSTGSLHLAFLCKIHINHMDIYLGSFKTEEECNKVYLYACSIVDCFSGDKKEFKKRVRQGVGKPEKLSGYFQVEGGAYKVVLEQNKKKVVIGLFATEEEGRQASLTAKRLKEVYTGENNTEFRNLVLQTLAADSVLTRKLPPIKHPRDYSKDIPHQCIRKPRENGGFLAYINTDSGQVSLGSYSSFEEAVGARTKAIQLMLNGCPASELKVKLKGSSSKA